MKIISQDRFLEIISHFHASNPVLVLGDIGVDKYTYGEVKRISPEAPVPILEVTEVWNKLGLAANVSDNLSSFGVNSTLFGITGDDSGANLVEELLEEKNLKTWGLVRDSERKTTIKERATTSNQQICRIDYESSFPISELIQKKLIQRVKEHLTDRSVLIIEDYGKGIVQEQSIKEIISFARQSNSLVLVDPSRSTPPLWYQGVDLIKPNRAEAELMVTQLGFYREKNLEKIIEILMDKLKLKKIVITLGAEGMAIFDSELNQKIKYIPTAANEVFDVSGAGDTVIASLGASLQAGASLEEACWIGNCAAGVVVRKRGTALCSIEELKEQYLMLKNRFQN